MKKGFTLAEVLVIIVILSILILFIVPKVLKSYKKAQIESFRIEVNSLYKSWKNDFSDKVIHYDEQIYNKDYSSFGSNKLDLINANFKYCVKIRNGKMTFLKIGNNKYYLELNGDINEGSIKESSIVEENNNFELCEGIDDVNVTLDANNGSVTPSTLIVKYMDKYGELPVPHRDDYEFLGWFTTIDGNEKITKDAIMNKTIDHILYAHYKPLSKNITIITVNASASVNNLIVNYNGSAGINFTPNKSNYALKSISCTNGLSYTYSNYTLYLNNVINDSICTISYADYNKELAFSNSEQLYEVFADGYYSIEAYGAQGGKSGGKGGKVTGRIYLTKGQVLAIKTGGTNGYNGGGASVGTTSYNGGGATTILLSSSTIITAAGGGGSGANGVSGGAGGNGSGAGGATTGSNTGNSGINGGGGSSSPTYARTCMGSCISSECNTCTYSYSSTCTKNGTCAVCSSCSYSTTCRRCTRIGADDECHNWLSYSCTKTSANCSKCGCSSYNKVQYSCTKTTSGANCSKCGSTCTAYSWYDCSVLGLPGSGGRNFVSSNVSLIENSVGINVGNGKVNISYVHE